MINKLKLKCENLMTFIPSNLYIHSSEKHETITFQRLTTPEFLNNYFESSLHELMEKRASLHKDDNETNQVYLYKDPFQLCYLTWPITDEALHYTITLGPLITDQLTSDEVKYMGFKMKLSVDNCFILESFYKLVPHYDQLQLARIASLFLDYLPIEPHLPQIIKEDHSILLPDEVKTITQKFENYDYVKHNYALEDGLLHAVELGDLDYIKKLLGQMNATISLPTRFPGNPLREQKNINITLNSILVRAALKGGLNQSIAHSLSHGFAIRIEQQISVDALLVLSNEIIWRYAESVKKYALINKSELTVNTVLYIRSHMVEPIKLSDIATSLHISKEHLSRTFKEEMGMTPTDFIHKMKTEESCDLLLSRRYSISDIAYTFGYSSPAHYTKMFKRFMGASPKQFQKKNT